MVRASIRPRVPLPLRLAPVSQPPLQRSPQRHLVRAVRAGKWREMQSMSHDEGTGGSSRSSWRFAGVRT
jgi:hypothetical protein